MANCGGRGPCFVTTTIGRTCFASVWQAALNILLLSIAHPYRVSGDDCPGQDQRHAQPGNADPRWAATSKQRYVGIRPTEPASLRARGHRNVPGDLPAAIAMRATVAYSACTVSQTRYTIRRVPPRLDRELRRRAHEERRSLNEVVLRALERGQGMAEAAPRHRDLDDLAGTWVDDPEFDRAIKAMDQVDPERWR